MKKFLRMATVVSAVLLYFCIVSSVSASEVVYKDISFTQNGKQSYVKSGADTVANFYKEQNITVTLGDKSNYDPKTELFSGMKLELNQGFFVKVQIDDKTERVKVSHDTQVGKLIGRLEREREIKYVYEGSLVRILKENDNVLLSTQKEDTFVIVETIPFVTEIVETDELDEGVETVVREGALGEIEITVTAQFEAGVEISRQVISEKTITEPVNKIVNLGTRVAPPAPPAQAPAEAVSAFISDGKYIKEFTMSATGYTAQSAGKNPGQQGYGITASGIACRPGVVAVDPTVIPLGTKLFVEGYGEALAADTGGAIKGNKIDLYFENYDDAFTYGRKTIKVYIIE